MATSLKLNCAAKLLGFILNKVDNRFKMVENSAIPRFSYLIKGREPSRPPPSKSLYLKNLLTNQLIVLVIPMHNYLRCKITTILPNRGGK